MFLSDKEIADLVQRGKLIHPFDQTLLRPASYMLRLSNTFRKFTALGVVDVLDKKTIEDNVGDIVKQDSFVIQPQEFVLACSIEKVSIHTDLLGLLSVLSHLGRIGLALHTTSALISPGFGLGTPSSITFELFSYNPAPLKLYSGMPLCHLLFAKLSHPPSQGYVYSPSLYTGQDKPESSRYYEEFKKYIMDPKRMSSGETES